MNSDERNTTNILREKYEERGWVIGKDNIKKNGIYDTRFSMNHTSNKDIPKLPLSSEEYKIFALLLGRICIEDKNRQLCDLYFEMQRRALFGNHYEPLEEMKSMENIIADIGINPEKYEKEENSNIGKCK